METLIKDIRYGVRSFLKRPGFLIIAVSTLALGIGATTAMFTVVNSVLLRPQYPEPERVVLFAGLNPRFGTGAGWNSLPDIDDWHKQSQSFEQIATFNTGGFFVTIGDETVRVRAAGVSPEFFPVFRNKPLHGRLFQPDDFQRGKEPVVISYELWQRQFGGSTSVLNTNRRSGRGRPGRRTAAR
jgi:putative ABC transport system permease protein